MKQNKDKSEQQSELQSDNSNLVVARKLLKEVRDPVISVHDIISTLELTSAPPSRSKEFEERYGKERWGLFVDYGKLIGEIREKLLSVVRMKYEKFTNSIFLCAMQMLGFGECGELSCSIYARFQLLKDEDVAQVVLAKRADIQTNHSIVIIGNIDKLSLGAPPEVIRELLDGNAVIIDPLLNLVFPADQTDELFVGYIKMYGIDCIYSISPIQKSHDKKSRFKRLSDIDYIQRSAKVVCEGTRLIYGGQIDNFRKRFDKLSNLESDFATAPTLFHFDGSSMSERLESITQELIVKPEWKFNKSQQKYWLRSGQKDVKSVEDYFVKHRLSSENISVKKVVGSDDRVLLIEKEAMESVINVISTLQENTACAPVTHLGFGK